MECILRAMAFHIRSPRADQLLRELQALTGESLTGAVTRALDERLARERVRQRGTGNDPLTALQETWSRLKDVPIRDSRPADEILGYGADGLFS